MDPNDPQQQPMDTEICPKCGSNDTRQIDRVRYVTFKYKAWQCNQCGEIFYTDETLG